ncbi:MAG: CHASE3 domain-containing protein, partial [Ferrovibrio sp.]
MRNLRIPTRIALAFGLLLLTAAAVATSVAFNLAILQAAKHNTDQATHILAEVAGYGLAMADQETALRGYVLTEDQQFLKPLQEGAAVAARSHAALALLLRDTASGSTSLETLGQRVANWQTNVSAVILRDFGDPSNAEAVYALIRSAEARVMMEQVRAALSAIEGDVRRALAERSAAQDAAFAAVYRYSAAGLAMLLLLATASGIVMHRTTSVPIRRLTGAMRRVAEGELDIAIGGGIHNDEVGEMERALIVFRENAATKSALEARQAEQAANEAQRLEAERHREQAAGQEIAALVSAVAGGDVSQRLSTDGKDGFYLVLAQEVNRLTSTVEDILDDVGSVLNALAEGDLSRRVHSSH